MSEWLGVISVVIGAFVGGFLTIIGQFVDYWLKNRKARALDEPRTKLLRLMLDRQDWRKISTLSRVIGADAETTKRLLIELGARGSEKTREDGEEVWGLISKHPLESIE